ncbi:MAG TPA: hypothetical protein VK324_15495 [Tepidisphaeraceae bacterium]|nr:hypothetical protein [Tepidisphaeraceae bacterium]
MTKPKRPRRKDPNVYPPGLNREKVEAIIAYYDARQTEDVLGESVEVGSVAEVVWMEVPQELVPQVRKLIAKHRKSA